MKIRHATKYDARSIINMLWHYHDSGDVEGLNISDEQTALRVLTHILAGAGIALVAEKNNQLVGMLIAYKVPFLWDNSKYIMNEIAYWVEFEHRGGTAGYRLIKEYVEKKMIANYTISQMEGQTLNYSRFGFKPIEHTWST
jgi:predicted N-acetyltransferase YhbS